MSYSVEGGAATWDVEAPRSSGTCRRDFSSISRFVRAVRDAVQQRMLDDLAGAAQRGGEQPLGRRSLTPRLARAELHCGCGARAFYPFKLPVKTCGAKRVDRVHGRFRCKQCGGRPVRVGVTNMPARGPQWEDAWTVTLLDASAG